MTLPSADTPLYNHPLPEIEDWLRSKGCQQDAKDLSHWTLQRPDWEAELWMEVEGLSVRYSSSGSGDVMRSFKYSLSRKDLEAVIFSGP